METTAGETFARRATSAMRGRRVVEIANLRSLRSFEE
jgi:hypothetical protein